MIKIGKYSVVQSGNFLLQENIPLSVECDGIHIEIMYMESNESSLYIVNKRYWKKTSDTNCFWGKHLLSISVFNSRSKWQRVLS